MRLSLKTGRFSNFKSQNPLELENLPDLKNSESRNPLSLKTGRFSNSKSQSPFEFENGRLSNSKSQLPFEFENWPVLKLKIAKSA
jgi:hypothetical protein